MQRLFPRGSQWYFSLYAERPCVLCLWYLRERRSVSLFIKERKMRLFNGHLALYIERNSRPFRKEFYAQVNRFGCKLCFARLVIWYKTLRYSWKERIVELTKEEQKTFESKFDIKTSSDARFVNRLADVLFEMTGDVNLRMRLYEISRKVRKE